MKIKDINKILKKYNKEQNVYLLILENEYIVIDKNHYLTNKKKVLNDFQRKIKEVLKNE